MLGSKISEIHQEIIKPITNPCHIDLPALIDSIVDITMLRARVLEGEYQGASTLWLITLLSWFHSLHCDFFLHFWKKFQSKLTLDDLRVTVSTGPYQGTTLLCLLGLLAAKGKIEPFEAIWEKFGKAITYADLQVQIKEYQGLSLLGALMGSTALYCPGLIKKIPVSLPKLTEKTVFIGLDLDYTHFLSHIMGGIHWIGSKERWIELYQKAADIADEKGVSLIFAIITGKASIDYLALAALEAFLPFLVKHNPMMTVDQSPNHWCLVNIDGRLFYLNMADETARTRSDLVPPGAISHVMFVPPKGPDRDPSRKTIAIKNFCRRMGIPLEHALLLDDDPSILDQATICGIETVSFNCFGDKTTADEAYINKNLDRIEAEFIKKVEALIEKACAAAPIVKELTEKLEVMKLSDVPPLRFSALPVEKSLSTESASKLSPQSKF